MPNIEEITRLLSETKASADAEIHLYWSPLMQLFIPASKAERSESATAFYHWAEENADGQPLKFHYAQILLSINNLLGEIHASVLPLLLQARNGCEERGDEDGVAMSSLFLGLAYRTMGNFDLALKTLLAPYMYFKQTGRYPVLLEGSCNSLANVNLQLHNYEEAFSLFRTGYETGMKIGDVFFPVLALNGMGKAKMLQDKPDEAMEYFHKALQESQKIGSPMQIGDTLIELAAVNFRAGNFAVAEQMNKEALGVYAGNFPGAEITCLVNLGEIHLKQSRWSEAMEALNQGLALAVRINVKPKMYQVHLLLSKVYKAMNDPARSLYHHEIFHELWEKVQEEDSARKLADAKLIFEAEQTKKENVIIRKQKLEIENKNQQLQQTIDELTITKISRKAKGITLFLGIALIVAEEPVFGYVLRHVGEGHFLLSITAKIIVIFSLRPLNIAIEGYLLRQFVLKQRQRLRPMAETAALDIPLR